METMLWQFDKLKKVGRQFNSEVTRAFHEYCSSNGGVPMDLHAAGAFTALVMANLNPDHRRRDQFLRIIQKNTINPKSYQNLKILRWSAAQKILQVYAKVPHTEPDIETLINMQRLRHHTIAPTWASTMPDLIYAMSRFPTLTSDILDELMMPFGASTQQAYALFSGVRVNGAPKMVHHESLRQFCISIAHNTGTPDAFAWDIRSGLQVFGEGLKKDVYSED